MQRTDPHAERPQVARAGLSKWRPGVSRPPSQHIHLLIECVCFSYIVTVECKWLWRRSYKAGKPKKFTSLAFYKTNKIYILQSFPEDSSAQPGLGITDDNLRSPFTKTASWRPHEWSDLLSVAKPRRNWEISIFVTLILLPQHPLSNDATSFIKNQPLHLTIVKLSWQQSVRWQHLKMNNTVNWLVIWQCEFRACQNAFLLSWAPSGCKTMWNFQQMAFDRHMWWESLKPKVWGEWVELGVLTENHLLVGLLIQQTFTCAFLEAKHNAGPQLFRCCLHGAYHLMKETNNE